MKNKTLKYTILQLLIIALVFILVPTCHTQKKTKPCSQCPQYTELHERVKVLEKRHLDDSITMEILGSDYIEIWNENQIFSSMLSEIETKPGGHKILKELWDEHRTQ